MGDFGLNFKVQFCFTRKRPKEGGNSCVKWRNLQVYGGAVIKRRVGQVGRFVIGQPVHS